jgi:hypothetical protein
MIVRCCLTILLFTVCSALYGQIYLNKTANGFWIKEGKQKVLFFQRETNDSIAEYARSNYFHPLYDLKGNCLTEDFPADHLHHRGLFWAWHQVLVDGKQICDTWELKNFTQSSTDIEFTTNENGSGVFSYTAYWHTKEQPNDPFLQEKTRVTVYQQQANYRRIDFEITIRALEHNLQLGGSNDEKGYGGFSARLKTDASTVFTNDRFKPVVPTNLAIEGSSFIDVYNKKMKNGVLIYRCPQNPGKAEWILRQEKSMQNCVWPGRTAVNLYVDKPITLKYTLIVHQGKLRKKCFEKLIKSN